MTQKEKLELDELNRSWMLKPTELANRYDRLTSTAKSMVSQKEEDVDFHDLRANKIRLGSETRIVVAEIR